MTWSPIKWQPKEPDVSSLIDAGVPPNDWPIMQEFKESNERNIRKSIARTDKAEREERIKQGLWTPPPKEPKTPTWNRPRTPKQKLVINYFGKLISKSQEEESFIQFYEMLNQ